MYPRPNRLETQADRILKEAGFQTRPPAVSIKAEGLDYLEAIAEGDDGRVEEPSEPMFCERVKRLVSLLAINMLNPLHQKIYLNHVIGNYTFRDMATMFNAGGKSKLHLMFHGLSEELQTHVLYICAGLKRLNPLLLDLLEDKAWHALHESLVVEKEESPHV